MRPAALGLAIMLIAVSCGAESAPSPTPAPASPRAAVPCGPGERFERHAHAHLTVVIRGQLRTVPANIGITATSICWVHTHDSSGIIHIEAGDDRVFTLGDFFSVWGKPLSSTAVADDETRSGESLRVTLNQTAYTDPPGTIPLNDLDDIVLQLGPPLPTVAPYVWPQGY